MSKLILQRALVAAQPFRAGDVIHRLTGSVTTEPTLASLRVSDKTFVEDELGLGVTHSCAPSALFLGVPIATNVPVMA